MKDKDAPPPSTALRPGTGRGPRSPGALCYAVVILAAGASSRMGKPKMLLPWGKTSVIGHLIGQWQAARADRIAVTIAAGDKRLEQELDRLAFPEQDRIRNPAPEFGMFSSIQCAVRWPGWKTREPLHDPCSSRRKEALIFSQDNNEPPYVGCYDVHGKAHSRPAEDQKSRGAAAISHWAIVLGDQPHLRIQTLLALLRLGATHPGKICQLSRQGRPRHPVLLPRAAFEALAVSRHDNLKQFLQAVNLDFALEESEDPGLDLDIDRPEHYEEAIRLFR